MIRAARLEDAAAIAAIYAPYVRDTAISLEDDAPDAGAIRARMGGLERFPWLVAERGGEVAGYAYAGAHHARAGFRWSVDAAIYLRAEVKRRGVGRALYARLFDILAAQGFRNCYAGVTLPNAASVGLHEAMGFAPVGVYRAVGFKFGRWHDVGWWERVLNAFEGTAPEPRAFCDMNVK